MSNPLLSLLTGAATAALIEPTLSDRVTACLDAVMQNEHVEAILAEPTASNDDGFWFAADDWRAAYRPYVVVNGILQIPVKGVLLNNFPFAIGRYATGYEYIWRAFQRGLDDGSVRGIALICDTPGGMVAGNFDLVDKMYAARGKKPVWGFAADAAYSAGYSIISVADKIYVSRSGGVGSIGVVTSHTDASGALANAGLKITWIFAGKHKVDGNSTEPLADDVKARFQSRIDELYGVFTSTVARNRGMEEQAVRDTEALTFTAAEATSNGLADEIGSLDDAVSAFAGFLDDQSNNGEDEMAEPASGTVDQAALDTAVTTARAEGHTAGMAAQKSRINAIVGSDVGKKRPTAALSAALKTDMSVDETLAFIGDLPEESAVAPTPAAEPAANVDLDGAMGRAPKVDVGAGAGNEKGEADKDDSSATLALIRSAGLVGFNPAPAK